MAKKRQPRRSNLFALLCFLFILGLYVLSNRAPGSILYHPKLQLFKTMFISIMIEAMPFILIGVLISALLHVFVTDRMIRRFIPTNPLLGILTATVLGIIFPICECGMVPAIRGMLRKGMPVHVATTFILVGPIINPVVFWSTMTAFRSAPEVAYARMGLAFAVALVVGLIVYRFVRTSPLRDSHAASHTHDHDHSRRSDKISLVMGHATNEFFEMGKYMLFGSILVGFLLTFIPNASLAQLGHGEGSGNAIMMGLGFLLSLCSTSDAFVAQSFLTTFSSGSLVAFMVFGAMMNLKGLLMMHAVFKIRFILLIGALTAILVYIGTLALDYTVLK